MFLSLSCPPSLHNKTPELRAAFKRELTIQLAGKHLPRKLYRVSLVYQGDWFKPNGEPRRRDPDNQTKVLFDVLAECLGFDDCWLNRDFRVRCEQATSERVTILLE